MSAVIFDITQPPIGEVTIPLNNHEYVGVRGLESIVSLGTEYNDYACVTLLQVTEGDIRPTRLSDYICIRRGESVPVAIRIEERLIAGSLRNTS